MIVRSNLIINNQLIAIYSTAFIDYKKPTVLFLHGWRSNAGAWESVMNKLTEIKSFYNYVSIDLPGFGYSPAPQKDWNLDNYAEIVVECVKKLKMHNVILVGHSFGGRISIKITSSKFARVQKLVLVGSAGFTNNSISNKLKNLIAKTVKPIFSIPFLKPVKKKIYHWMGAEDYIATPHLQDTFKNVISEDLTKNLPKIQQETMLIWGKEDEATPPSFGTRMHKHITNSELFIIPEADHYVFISKEKEFINIFQKFLNPNDHIDLEGVEIH